MSDSNKVTIAVDLDSTLNNLDDVWILDKYNKLYNDNLKKEDMTTWNCHEYVKPECGKKVFDILMEPGFFYNLGYKDVYTYEGFKWLCDNYDVYIVSSCHPNTVMDKQNWVRKMLPFFDLSKFVACSRKEIINTDWLIDDGPHNITDFPGKTVKVDMPYNQNVDILDYTVKLDNWNEIREYFEKELNK